MAIKYAVQQISRKGVTPGSTETKYYAQISAISVGDVLSVMNTVSMLLSIELANGRIVELGDLGRFRATLRSKSCDKPEEFKREMIHGNRVIFVPGAQIRHKMTYAKYLKADLSNPSADPTQPGNEPGEGSGSQTPPTGDNTGGGSNTGNDQIGV